MIEPLKNRVAIKRDEKHDIELESGLVLLEDWQKTPQEGEILAVGPECRDVKVGDRVMFGIRDGQMHKVDGQDILFMREDALFGILHG